jgi:dynein light intermediate chain 1
LSNKFAYGYGYVNLFSPPTQGAGAALLGGEAEEAAKVECHCFPGEPEKGFEAMLRRIFQTKGVRQGNVTGDENENGVGDDVAGEERGGLPSVTILLSWHQPWTFLSTLRTWFVLLARALLSEQARKDENPLEMIKEYGLNITVVLQHVEAQEELEREGYKDDTFDYISQSLRTCLLPLSAGLIYTPTNPAPTQPGGPLTEAQKLIYTSLGLDVGTLQTRRPGSAGTGAQAKKEELAPRHNVVDRMAILVPGGWDSVGKIRLLSETFSPETMLEGWAVDLDKCVAEFNRGPATAIGANGIDRQESSTSWDDGTANTLQANGTSTPSKTAELYSSQPSPTLESLPDDTPMSPSKLPRSAISPYEQAIINPHAHKIHSPPRTEVAVKPEQEFLAEMRAHLQRLEAQDKERERRDPSSVHTTYNSISNTSSGNDGNVSKGPALEELGDVSFNVGGVSYNTVSAEAAIERLKRPGHPGTPTTGGAEASSRTGTPRPRREEREESSSGAKAGALETDKLEEYFASLMKRGSGAAASREGTPSK